MDKLKFIFRLFFAPQSAMSEIMDNGSWLFSAGIVALVALIFFATINAKLDAAYHVPTLNEYYQPTYEDGGDAAAIKASFDKGMAEYNAAMASRTVIPIVGDRFFTFFSFEPDKFYQPLLLISVFYIPTVILLMSLFGGVGSFALVLRRDYGTLAVCSLTAWAAAHLPFAIGGIVAFSQNLAPVVYLSAWIVSGVLFGVFMVFALRTIFGSNYGVAILVVSVAWLSMSLGAFAFRFISPWLFSPFLLFYAIFYFGGSLGGEVRGFGNAFRQKQNLKRFLHNATVNPRDADAHVQLGLIYLQRRQESKAVEHFLEALEIDRTEIDANYEMGKIARSKGDPQTALRHFALVVEQNDKHALSEVWREIGAAYMDADMLAEAGEALEKFVDRRSSDVEGLYYFGKLLKTRGEMERAREMFTAAVESAKASPGFKQQSAKAWGRLAQKEL